MSANPIILVTCDNASRDLFGLTHIALELARNGFSPLFIPWNLVPAALDEIILSTNAAGILLGNFRKTAIPFMSLAKSRGLKVWVHESEGCIPELDFEAWKSDIEPYALTLIDRFFMWGRRQSEILINEFDLPEDSIIVTGSSRLSSIASVQNIVKDGSRKEFKVLIGLSCASPHPRYLTKSEEFRLCMETLGMDLDSILESYEQQIINRETLIAAGTTLAKRLPPNAQVELRPHPFSARNPLLACLQRHSSPSNMFVGSSTSPIWQPLMNCSAYIHQSSISAYEAFACKVPSICLTSPKNLENDRYDFGRTCKLVDNVESLVEETIASISEDKPRDSFHVSEISDKVNNPWINLDASRVIADAVMADLGGARNHPTHLTTPYLSHLMPIFSAPKKDSVYLTKYRDKLFSKELLMLGFDLLRKVSSRYNGLGIGPRIYITSFRVPALMIEGR